MIIRGYISIYLYLGIILLVADILKKKYNVKETLTRKIVHISVSFCYVILFAYFKNTIHLIIPPITFIILNYISYKKVLFKGMELEDKSLGTVYYPISVFILALITYFYNGFYPYFGIGLFCMGLGDGFAPIIAEKIKSKKIYKDKTLSGSLTVFIISILITLAFNSMFVIGYSISDILIIGVGSFVLELIGIKGLDNLYLPLGIAFLSFSLGGF